MLLGYVIEKVTGEALDLWLEKEVFTALGLSGISFHPVRSRAVPTSFGNEFERLMISDPAFSWHAAGIAGQFARWRTDLIQGEVNDGNSFYVHGGVAGHAGLFSDAQSLEVIVTLLLNEGRTAAGVPFLRPDTVKTFTSSLPEGNGLGWWTDPDSLRIEPTAQAVFGHGGFTGVFVLACPEKKRILVLLTNRQKGGFVFGSQRYKNLKMVSASLAKFVLEKM